MSLFFLFGSLNRWFCKKEVRCFNLPFLGGGVCMCVYMLTGACYTQISVPTSFTGTCAADEVNSAALKSVKGMHYRRRREFNRLTPWAHVHVFVLRSSLWVVSAPPQLESIITAAPVLKKCQHQLKRPSVCLSVLLSACFVCLFLWEQGGRGGECMTKWFAEFSSPGSMAPDTCHISVLSCSCFQMKSVSLSTS